MEKEFDALTKKWLQKIQNGETINIKDLYAFSKIKLKRKRMRKKFHKNFTKYIPDHIRETYWGILCANPFINTFKLQLSQNLDISQP